MDRRTFERRVIRVDAAAPHGRVGATRNREHEGLSKAVAIRTHADDVGPRRLFAKPGRALQQPNLRAHVGGIFRPQVGHVPVLHGLQLLNQIADHLIDNLSGCGGKRRGRCG